jgi:hypothetical protein
VRNSPFHVLVNPGLPSASTSTHNIRSTSIRSKTLSRDRMELRVIPLDRFNNSLANARGYAVSINGDGPFSLVSPSFSYAYKVPKNYAGELTFNFMLDGEEIYNSPITVVVASTPILFLTILLAPLGVLLLIGLRTFASERWARL